MENLRIQLKLNSISFGNIPSNFFPKFPRLINNLLNNYIEELRREKGLNDVELLEELFKIVYGDKEKWDKKVKESFKYIAFFLTQSENFQTELNVESEKEQKEKGRIESSVNETPKPMERKEKTVKKRQEIEPISLDAGIGIDFDTISPLSEEEPIEKKPKKKQPDVDRVNQFLSELEKKVRGER
jgi:hypothetical protein